MHLKTLTVKGFKSFASATSFEFEPGVTAVVGPNGSGKSNVVDALSWVMGEQGAKSLRGGKMEDVIFAGTSGRAALGRAHVSLTIDNTDGALPIEYSEVTISRTLFRTGGSEYAINGNSCRLLDIQELLSDSGLGREMHVIVGQGQLDRILHATPEERRGFIEEASGVLKHRRRKEKTLRKLASMETNVSRLEDLTGEIGRQLTPLGRQAKVARRAQRIQHDVRDARARLYADDWVQASTELDTDAEELERLAERLRTLEGEHDRATEAIARLEADAARLAPRVSRARDTWYALSQLRERYESLRQLAQERQRTQATPVGRAHLRDPEQLAAHAEGISRELEEAVASLAEAEEAHERAGTVRSEAEEEARSAEAHHAHLVAASAERRENIASLRGAMATARSQHESLQARRREQEDEVAAIQRRLDDYRADLERMADSSGPTDEDTAAASTASEEAHAATETTQAALDESAAKLNESRRDMDAASARVAALKESLPAADATEAIATEFRDHTHRVRDRLTVDPRYAAALSAGLGPVADGLSVGDPAHLQRILTHAQDKELGVVSLLLGDHGSQFSSLTDQGDWEALLRELDETAYRDVVWAPRAVTGGELADHVRHLARHCLIAPTLEIACALRDRLVEESATRPIPPDWAIVLQDGTILQGLQARGGSAAGATGLEISARIDAAEQAVETMRERYSLAEAEHEKAAQDHRRTRDAARTAREEFTRISRLSSANAAALAKARTLVTSTEEELDGARTRLEDLVGREPELAEKLDHAVGAVSAALELQDEDGGEALERADQARTKAAEAAAAARSRETEALLTVRGIQGQIDQFRQRRDSARRAVAAEKAAHAEVERQEKRRRAQYAATSRVLSMIGTVCERLENSLAVAEAERERLQTGRAALETRLAEAREHEKTQRDSLDAHRAKAHSGELERATREAKLESLREAIFEELSLTTDHLIADYGPHLPIPVLDEAGETTGEEHFVREVQERRLQRARKDLKALGKVNPLALEEFAALEERHTYLVQQLEDLKASREDLEEIIRDVDEHVRQVFTQAFHDTQEQFVRVFATLFPGGEGKLVLTDPHDMLTTGIEVHAKPAGKKVKRLSLLSGGERSLTAIAMLVAIFKARPSPFYVMDEVEAALDDRNLGRLLKILKELQESSQLIIITHQKRTMEISDALYGVSMRGDGITQVISQKLADLR
ncbi:chromosome segregation protein SMC [Curtobacterium sp. S6]|uniref:chromosome segregation protein SMC n=1 Tax=Curtobacterium sp. S6 TaxID=1479623 RepID=UPI0004AA8A83|nr:chromosome segregation protein SMC [Curtobacterium sp. S6]